MYWLFNFQLAPYYQFTMSKIKEHAWVAEPHEVQAILAGRQVQFRRPIPDVRLFSAEYDRRWYPHVIPPGRDSLNWAWFEGPPHGPSCYELKPCPWGKPGDRIRVQGTSILLEVESVRVERVQEMKEKDALAEGVEIVGGGRYCLGAPGLQPQGDPVAAYRTVHARQYGLEAWTLNGWVWIVKFRVIETQ